MKQGVYLKLGANSIINGRTKINPRSKLFKVSIKELKTSKKSLIAHSHLYTNLLVVFTSHTWLLYSGDLDYKRNKYHKQFEKAIKMLK